MTTRILPAAVHETMAKWMLVDGLDLVFDWEKSRGCRLYDAKHGRTYLDLFSFFASNPIGYNHPGMRDPAYLEELHRVAALKPSCADCYTPEQAAFVDAFGRMASRGVFEHFFFIEGGSLAVENALKAAFDWKVRKNLAAGRGERGHEVVHFREAFHGRSGYTIGLTNTHDPNKTKYFPKFDWPRFDNPKLRFPITDAVLDEVRAAEERVLGQIEAYLQNKGHDVAAIIIEPIQGEGGDNHFRTELFQGLRRLADKYEVILIFDEVQSGIGLTGKFWAWEHHGVAPDMVCFGKKTQVCGFASTRRIDDVDSVFKAHSRINSTFGGNLVDMVRARRYLELMEQEHVIEHAAKVGDAMLEDLRQLKSPLVSNVRGRGLMIAFDLPSEGKRDEAYKALYAGGVLALKCGALGIRIRPSLTFTREDAAEAVAAIADAVKKVA